MSNLTNMQRKIAFALGSLVMLVAAAFTLFAVPSLDRPWTHLFEPEASARGLA